MLLLGTSRLHLWRLRSAPRIKTDGADLVGKSGEDLVVFTKTVRNDYRAPEEEEVVGLMTADLYEKKYRRRLYYARTEDYEKLSDFANEETTTTGTEEKNGGSGHDKSVQVKLLVSRMVDVNKDLNQDKISAWQAEQQKIKENLEKGTSVEDMEIGFAYILWGESVHNVRPRPVYDIQQAE